MQIVNLTPHVIKLNDTNLDQSTEIPPVRVVQETSVLYTIGDVPVKLIHSAKPSVASLPSVQPNTIYIVSRLVSEVYKDVREDLVFPYELIRSKRGRIFGCKSLARFESNVS